MSLEYQLKQRGREVWDAYVFAADAHKGQFRKYTGTPYINHPCAVAKQVIRWGGEDHQVAAALLHDTVEDCDEVTQDTIEFYFTDLVCRIVDDLTDRFTHEAFPYLNRAQRKRLELERIRHIAPMSRLVKLADLVDNTKDIVENDPKFAITYLPEKAAVLEALGYGRRPPRRQT